jgi:ribosomal protein S6
MTDTPMVDFSEDLNEAEDSTRVYEVGYLLLPSIPEEHIPEAVTAIKAVIKGAHGVSLSEEDPRLRPLAYEMTKHIGTENVRFNTAYFGSMKFEVVGNELPTIKAGLEALDSMLRFLIIKIGREQVHISRPVSTNEDVETVGDLPVQAGEAQFVPEVSSQDELDKSIDALVA